MGRRDRRGHGGSRPVAVSAGAGRGSWPLLDLALERPGCIGHNLQGRDRHLYHLRGMLSSAVGGYLAGRLRATWAGVHNDEIYFHDTAHGLLAWAFATILGATALAAATTHIVAGAAAGLAPTAATTAATSQGQPTDIYVDTLLRTEPRPAGADAHAANQPAAGAANPRAEVGRLIAPVLRKGGDVSPADRTYLAKVVAARTGAQPARSRKARQRRDRASQAGRR